MAQASVSIGDGRLVTRIDGQTDLNMELRDPRYDTLSNLSLAIDKLKNYECRLKNTSRVAKSFCLEDLGDQDFNRKAVHIKLDKDRFYDWEIAGSKQTLSNTSDMVTSAKLPHTQPILTITNQKMLVEIEVFWERGEEQKSKKPQPRRSRCR